MSMKRFFTVSAASILLFAAGAVGAGGDTVAGVVADYVSGGNRVVEAYRATAKARADEAIAQINAARTIPEAASAANKGRTRISVARGEAVDDKDRRTLNSLGDYIKIGKDRLHRLRASSAALKPHHAAHLGELKVEFESQRERVTRAEEARKAALRQRR